MTPEQQARDLLERMGIEGAQKLSEGELVELAGLIAHTNQVGKWRAEGQRMLAGERGFSFMFALGGWWADRPWRSRGKERELFLTHTPDFFMVGREWQRYRITRLESLAPTALEDGGFAPCWRVYGVPVNNDVKDLK